MQPMRAAAAAVDERRSNQTFTPPTSSLSHESPSSNDLHSTLSALSVDLPPLNYALEKFLVDGVDATVNDSVYEVAEEFSSGCALTDQGNARCSCTSQHSRRVLFQTVTKTLIAGT